MMLCFRENKDSAVMAAVLTIVVALSCATTLPLGGQTTAKKSAPKAIEEARTPAAGQLEYPTAQVAVQAFITALRNHDDEQLLKVLGPDGKGIIYTGDATEDRKAQDDFLAAYDKMHRLLTEQSGLTILYVGAENWPSPLPLVRDKGAWFFYPAAGKEEIVFRHIGENELNVIQVCGELVAAQKEYYSTAHDGATQQYAQKMLSTSGKQDGLYWPVATGEKESPLGPMLAAAEVQGYNEPASPQRSPFYGYYFRILKSQGANAPGGAKNYLVNGAMTRGFAFMAYPAEYRTTGVMTFIVGEDGVVYQRDLGPKTTEIAKTIRAFNPTTAWVKALPEETAAQ